MTEARMFDTKTHHFDNKGRLLKRDPYRLHVKEGTKYFERPVGSGNLFHENGVPAGRLEVKMSDDGRVIKKTYNFNSPHQDYVEPLRGAEKLISEREELKRQNAELQAELAAVRAERAAGQPEAQAVKGEATQPEEKSEPAKTAKKDSGAPITDYEEML